MILVRSWAALSAAALAVSLLHALVDWHIGLFGATSEVLSTPQAALAWLTAALYGWWAWSLAKAAAGSRSYLASVLVLTVGWALAGNGLVVFACLPPCPGGFPHQDIAHISSLAAGAVGGVAVWLSLRDQPGSVDWPPPTVAMGLVILGFLIQGLITSVW